MDAIWQGLSGIFEVVLIAGLGFFLAKKGWFWENAAKDLTRLTMTVALPPLMIHSLYANFTHDALLEAAPDLVLPFVSIFASYLAGHVLASLLHISKGRRGIFICTCCIANAIFIGVPVNVALFGEASVPSCMLYYLANTTMFWALGAYLIIRDAGDDEYDDPRDRSRGGCGVLDDGQLRLACPRCILCAVLYVYALVRGLRQLEMRN